MNQMDEELGVPNIHCISRAAPLQANPREEQLPGWGPYVHPVTESWGYQEECSVIHLHIAANFTHSCYEAKPCL